MDETAGTTGDTRTVHPRLRRLRMIIVIAAIVLAAIVALFVALPSPPRYTEEEYWQDFAEEGRAELAPDWSILRTAPMAAQQAEWSISAVRTSSMGTHAHLKQVVNGRPVIGAWAVRHDFNDGAYRLEGRRSALRAERSSAPSVDALSTAIDAIGITSLRADPSVERAYFPTKDGLSAVEVVTIPSLAPLGDWRVIIDERTGEVLAQDDLLIRVSGSGIAFEAVPEIGCGQELGAGDKELMPHTSKVTLGRLDGSGYLRGGHVEVISGRSERVNQPDYRYHFPPSHTGFEQVTCYNTIDNYFEYISEIGVSGYGGEPIVADAHGYSGDNSFFSPLTGKISFGDGGIPDGQDPEIILHELGHALHWRAVPDYASSIMSRAVSEGLADFIACSYFDNPLLAEWDAAAYSSDCPPYLRRMDLPKRYPDDLTGEVHRDGLIWATALWAARREIGAAKTDRILLESLFLLQPYSTLRHAAFAFLEANEILYGAENSEQILAAFEEHGLVGDAGGMPSATPSLLTRVYPNPFNPQTTLRYVLPEPGNVRIEIFDVRGRVVTRLLEAHKDAGSHIVTWDGTNDHGSRLPSGVYVYRVTAARQVASGKVILLK